jgi:hypothetical protein
VKSFLGLLGFGVAIWLTTTGPDVLITGWTQQGGGVPSTVVDMGPFVVLGQGAGLVSLDVSDPTHPRQVGSLVMPQMVRAAAASGAYLVVVVCNATVGPSPAVPCSLRILELAGDGALGEMSHLDLDGILSEVVVAAGHAYVAAGRTGIAVVDLGDATKPVLVGRVGGFSDVTRLAISGTQLAASSQGEVAVVDVTDAAQPRVLGRVTLKGDIGQLVVTGDAIYAIVEDQASGRRTLSLIDIHDVVNQLSVRQLPADGEVHAIAVAAGWLFVVTSGHLLTMDISTPTIPTLAASSYIALHANSAVASSHYLHVYVNTGTASVADRWILGGLRIVDVSDPGNVRVVGSHETAFATGTVAFIDADHVAATLTCVTCSFDSELWTLRLANDRTTTGPQRLGPIPLARTGVRGSIWDIQSREGLLYVAAWNTDASFAGGGLRVVDVSEPQRPNVLGTLELPQGAEGVALAGSTAFLLGGNEMYVVDVANPASPVLLGHQAVAHRPVMPWSSTLAANESGHTLLLGYEAQVGSGQLERGMLVYDASASPMLSLVAEFPMSRRVARIVIRGDIAWVGAGSRVLAVNIAVAADPRIVGQWSVDGYIRDMIVADDWVVATGSTESGYEGRLWGAPLLASDRLGGIKELEMPAVPGSLASRDGRLLVADGAAGLLVGRIADLFGPGSMPTATPLATATPDSWETSTPTATATPTAKATTTMTPTPTPTLTATTVVPTAPSVYLPRAARN